MGRQLRIARRNFNGGEVGPQLQMRSDLEPYKKSCSKMFGFLPTPYGTAVRAPGVESRSEYIAGHGFFVDIPFSYNERQAFRVCLFASGRMVVFRGNGVDESAIVSNTQAHTYTWSQLQQLTWFQSGDVLFVFHTSHPPARIERHSDYDWIIKKHQFIGGPVLLSPPSGEAAEISETYDVSECSFIVAGPVSEEISQPFDFIEVSHQEDKDGAVSHVVPLKIAQELRRVLIKLEIGEHNLISGDLITISNGSFLNTRINKDFDYSGDYRVVFYTATAVFVEASQFNLLANKTRKYYDAFEITIMTQAPWTEEIWHPGEWIGEHDYRDPWTEYIEHEAGYNTITVPGNNTELWYVYTQFDPDQAQQILLTDEEYQANDFIEFSAGENQDVVFTKYYPKQDSGNVALSLEFIKHGAGGPYPVGTCVYSPFGTNVYSPGATNYTVTDRSFVLWKSEIVRQVTAEQRGLRRDYYALRLTIGSHAFVSGASAGLEGLGDWSGTAPVINAESTWITIDSRIFDEVFFGGNESDEVSATFYRGDSFQVGYRPALPTLTGASKAVRSNFVAVKKYIAIAEADIGNALPVFPATETAKWREVPAITGRCYAVSTSGIFKNTDIGRMIRIERDAPRLRGQFTVQGSLSGIIPCQGDVTLITEGGAWGGSLHLLESVDLGQSWEVAAKIEAVKGEYNGKVTRTAKSANSLFRVYMSEYVTESGYKCMWRLEQDGSCPVFGIIREVESVTRAAIDLITPVQDDLTTTDFSLGAMGGDYGYPRFGFIHEERLVIGGIPGAPDHVFLSSTSDWTRFDIGTLATSAFDFILPSSQAETMLWGISKKQMIFGTSVAEWKVSSRDAGSGINFSNFKIELISKIGSGSVYPVQTGDSIFFFERDGKTVRALAYEYEKDELSARQVDILAPHFPRGRAIAMAVTRSPYPVIWVLDDTHRLYAVVYDIDNKVMAWSEIDYGRGDANTTGSLCYWISSMIFGANEYLLLAGGSGQILSGGVFSNKTKMYPCCINLSDPSYGGCIPDYYHKAEGYAAELEPTLLTQDEENINGGHVFKTAAADLFLINSAGGEVWITGMEESGDWQKITYPSVPYTGRIRVPLPARSSADFRIKIRTTGSERFELAGLAVNFEQTNSEVV